MKQILLSFLLFAFGLITIAATNNDKKTTKNKPLKTAEISNAIANEQNTQATEKQNSPTFKTKKFTAPVGEVVGTTTYDLQTNSGMGRRVATNPPGNFHYVAWTMGRDYTAGAANRGTGFNFYIRNTGKWGPEPTVRIEPNTRVGWPSIGFTQGRQFSITHGGGMVFTFRVGNQSDWEEVLVGQEVNDTDGVWARAAVSPPNIYCIIGRQTTFSGIDGGLNFILSEDNGNNWTSKGGLDQDYSEFYSLMSADDYQIDAKDSVVSIIFGSYTTDLVLYKSFNKGDNWEKTIVNTNSNPKSRNIGTDDNPDFSIEPHFGSDGGNSVLMDSEGIAHVVYSAHISYNLFDNDVNEGSAYAPLDWISALFYWNETMNEPQIIGKTIMNDNNGDGVLGAYLNNVLPLSQPYYANSVCQPQLGLDAADNIYVSYAALVDGDFVPTQVEFESSADEGVTLGNFTQEFPQDSILFSDVFMIKSLDKGATWQGPLNVTKAAGSEEVYPSIAKFIRDTIFLAYQHDPIPGTLLQIGQDMATLNEIAVVKILPEDINDEAAAPDSEPYISSMYSDILALPIDMLTVPQNCSADNSLILRANAWGMDYPDGLIENIQIEGLADYSKLGVQKEALYVEDSAGNKSDTIQITLEVIEDTLPPEIEISGACKEFAVLAGSTWTKPDIIITDFVMIDGNKEDSGCDLSKILQIEDNVNTAVVGTYTVVYTVSDFSDNEGSLTLNVEVVAEDNLGPELTITGLPELIGVNDFFDPDEDVIISVKDNVDCENVTLKIEGLEDIDTEVLGDYEITITATDQSGNTTVENRTVTVGDKTPPEINLTGPNTVNISHFSQCGADNIYNANDEWGFTAKDDNGLGITDVTNMVEVVYNNGNAIDCNCGGENELYEISYKVTDANGNSSEALRLVRVLSCILNVEDNPIYQFVDIFPNPTNGELNIETTNLKIYKISVYNLLGKNIITLNENQVKALTQLDLSNQAEGIYMVNVFTDKGTITRKVNVLKN